MRTRSWIALAGAFAALVVPVSIAAGEQRASPAGSALTLMSSHPVTVRGHGFAARTRVRVTLSMRGKLVRRPTADVQGRFTVAFPAVIDRCSAWTISASQPGRATVLLHGAKPACAPASAN